MLCSLFWFLYYKLVFAKKLFRLQIPFVCKSWFASLGDFNVFVLVFHYMNSFGNWTQTRPSPWSLEVARKVAKFIKKNTRRRPLVWSQRGPFCYFLVLFSYLSPPWVWMWCTMQCIFMMCVVSVVTVMVISANIGVHNN